MEYYIYLWSLYISAAITISVGLYLLIKSRNTTGAHYFLLLLLAVAIWTLGTAMEISSTTLSQMKFWSKMQYFSYCYLPVFLFQLCVMFAGQYKHLQWKKIMAIYIIPTICILLVWTNDDHGLVRHHEVLDNSGTFPVIIKTYGPIFYVIAGYAYILMIVALLIFLHAAFVKKTVSRRQGILTLFGMGIPVISNIMYSYNLVMHTMYDLTPALVGPAGLFVAYGIFRYRLFNLVPLARATVFDTMDKGILVLDQENRVMVVNTTFENMFHLSNQHVYTKQVEKVLCDRPELISACINENMTHFDFSLDESDRICEAAFSALNDKNGFLIGKMIIFQDVTERKKIESDLKKQQWWRASMEERERMARDLHDNLGQVLGFINLQTQGIRKELKEAGNDTVSDRLDKLVEASQMAHREIRSYIKNTRQSANIEKDFMDMLRQEIQTFESMTDITIKKEIAPDFSGEEFQPEKRIQIFYIIKETLNNIRKHAKANSVALNIMKLEDSVEFIIEDDGVGFDGMEVGQSKTRFGLNIMKERAQSIDGKLLVSSKPGCGSQIKLRVSKGGLKYANESNACR